MEWLLALFYLAVLAALFHGLYDLWKWNNRK